MRFLRNSLVQPRDLILERFHAISECIIKGTPVDYGPPEKGRIRFLLTGDSKYMLQNALLTAYDRTYKEWWIFWKDQYTSAQSSIPMTMANYDYMILLYAKNMRIRWIAKKWLNCVRTRIAKRRIVGEQDLYTLQSIPAHASIQIIDYASRSVYMFHFQTAYRSYLAALLYSSYGIYSPQIPKNPYTNIAWNYGQSLEMCRQICRVFSDRHGFPNPMLCSYMLCNYDIIRFARLNVDYLRIKAAESLFENINDPDSKDIYEETLNGLFELGIGREVIGWSAVRAQILLRSLPTDLMKRWDTLMIAAWIYETYSMPYKHLTNVASMNSAWSILFQESYDWWNAAPKTILQRHS